MDARKTWGLGLCFLHLGNIKGHRWNHRRVCRIYCALKLNLRIKARKRLKRDKPDALAAPEAPNMTSPADFMADRLGAGRQFRLPNVLDDFNREGLGIEVDFSLAAEGVIRSLGPSAGKTISQIVFFSGSNSRTPVSSVTTAPSGTNGWINTSSKPSRMAQDFATRWLRTYNNDRPNMGVGGITPAQKLKMAA